MPLNLSSKKIIDLLSNTKDLDSYAFYKKLDKEIKNIIGHKLFTLTVIIDQQNMLREFILIIKKYIHF